VIVDTVSNLDSLHFSRLPASNSLLVPSTCSPQTTSLVLYFAILPFSSNFFKRYVYG